MEAYNAGRYRRAAELLGQFVPNATGDPRLKGALMALGRSNLEIRDYVSATAQYLRVATEFARDPEATDARYRDLTAGRIADLKCPAGKSQEFLRDSKCPWLAVRVTAAGLR